MTSIRDYLIELAEEQYSRHHKPVVGMDCIAAKSRGDLLQKIAREVEQNPEEAALSHLKAYRNLFRNGAEGSGDTSLSWVFAGSDMQWFDGVVDRVARENVGWIEVSSIGLDRKSGRPLHLPCYTRKLGINHAVSSIQRSVDESADGWLARRAAWLSRYHSDVKIVHRSGAQRPYEFGTVATFSSVEHLVETDLVCVTAIHGLDGARFDVVEAFLKPDRDGFVGVVRQTEGKRQEPGVIVLSHCRLKLVA